MKLYIVRHGETDWNKARRVQGFSDIPLNEYGRHLARETAEGMKDIPFDLAYTSPLVRARETAEIILAGREIPLIESNGIKEMGFGEYEGMCISGALVMASLDNGMSILSLGSFEKYIVKGLVLLLAVAVDTITNRQAS